MTTTIAAFYDSAAGTLVFNTPLTTTSDIYYKGSLIEDLVTIIDSDGQLIDILGLADSAMNAAIAAAAAADSALAGADSALAAANGILSNFDFAYDSAIASLVSQADSASAVINNLASQADSDVSAAIALINAATAAADSDFLASQALLSQATSQAQDAIASADSSYNLSISTINNVVSTANTALSDIDLARDSAIADIEFQESVLQSQIDSINSTLTTSYYTIAQADSAINLAVSASELSLQSNIDSNLSTLENNYYTLVQADSAITLAVSNAQTLLQSNIDSNLSTLENNYYTIVQTDSEISTAVSAAQQTLQSNINAINSNLTTNYYTSAQTDSEISTSIAAAQLILQSNIDSVNSTLTTDYYTRTEVDSEVATSIASAQQTLQSNIDSVSSNLSTNYYTISTVNGIARESEIDVDRRLSAGGSYSDKVCLLSATYTFAALEDDTDLFKNGTKFATIDKGQTVTESLTEGDIISATNAFNATSNSIQLASILHSGTRFTQYRTRNSNTNTTYVKIYPLRSGSAYYLFNDYSSGDHDFAVSSSNNPTSLTEGTVTTLTLTPTSTDDGDFTLETTVPCLVYIGNSSRGDENILYPTAERILGQGTAVKVDNGDTLLTNGSLYYIDNYVGQISLHTTGDGAGGDTMAYQPYEFLGNEYIVPQTSIADYKIFTDKNITVYVRDASGTQIGVHNIDGSITPTSLAVGNQSGAGTNISTNGPFYFTGTGKFALRTNNTASDDEYSVIGHDKELKSSFVNVGLRYSLSAIETVLQSNIDSNQATLEQNYYTIVETDDEISTAISNLQTLLQSNIDSNQATLETNYYTIVQADSEISSAVSAAQTLLQSNIDSNQATLQNNYYTITGVNNAISSAQTTLRSEFEAADDSNASSINSVAADLSNNYYTITGVNNAISSAQTTLRSEFQAADDSNAGSINSVAADLSTNYYTITEADSEISTAVSVVQQTLQSNIDSVSSNLSTNYYTITQTDNIDADLQTLIGDLGTLSTGSVLSSEYITGISSNGWTYWLGQGTETLTDNEVFSITNGTDTIYNGKTVRFQVDGTQSNGLFTRSDRSHWTGGEDYQAYRVEIVFTLVSGGLDGAGVLVDWRNTVPTNYRTQIKLEDMLDVPLVTGVPLTASAVFVKPSNYTGTLLYQNIYVMVNYTGFGVGLQAKDIKIHKVTVRPASAEERGDGQVGLSIAAAQQILQSNIDSNQTTISETLATVNGIQAQYSLEINNNGAITGYRLISDENQNSSFIVAADQFAVVSPDGTDSAGAVFQVVTSPPEDAGVYINAGRLTIGGVGTPQIGDRAVTEQSAITVASATAGGIGVGGTGGIGWTTVATLTFNVDNAGEEILVGSSYSLYIADGSPNGGTTSVQLRFNGTALSNSRGPHSVTTASGTNTLLLRGYSSRKDIELRFTGISLFSLLGKR